MFCSYREVCLRGEALGVGPCLREEVKESTCCLCCKPCGDLHKEVKIPAVLGTGKACPRDCVVSGVYLGLACQLWPCELRGRLLGYTRICSPGDREHKWAQLLAWLESESCLRIAGVLTLLLPWVSKSWWVYSPRHNFAGLQCLSTAHNPGTWAKLLNSMLMMVCRKTVWEGIFSFETWDRDLRECSLCSAYENWVRPQFL